MLFVHEVHEVAGHREEEFEAAYRDGWLTAFAGRDDARLLWFLRQAHGTGHAYRVVTVTAVRDGAAWEELTAKVATGDLRDWAGEVDRMRHGLASKVLTPLAWSPLQDVDLAAVPVEPVEHAQDLFMEDTAWPHLGRLEAYVAKAGTQYVDTLQRAEAAGRSLLHLEAAFRPVFGTGRHREVVLWQRVARPELLLPLLTHEVPAEHRAPGTWMHDALEVRDRWESRLLRTASWSPLP
jgi:hypothetical protein